MKPMRPAPPSLLQRILDTPNLADVVPRLPPEMLHKVIQACGLEACGGLVALATPAQLMRVFDLDLWRSARPGQDEMLDGDRFGVWLDVLIDCGAAVAAQKLAGVDLDLVIAALAQHVRVFDSAAMAAFTTLDGEEVAAMRRPGDALACDVGGYHVEARRAEAWDALTELLPFLEAEHRHFFDRLMRGCRHLSNSTPEPDGFHDLLADREQDVFDLAVERDERREQQGFVAPADARAFLHLARQLQLAGEAIPPRNPVVAAYFRGIDWRTPVDGDEHAAPIAAIVEVLSDAGVLPQPPRALLGGAAAGTGPVSRLQAQMQCVHDRDFAAYSRRTEEFAFLTNTMVAGCSIQGRPFTLREASDAVAAACSLGLEYWPRQWGVRTEDFLVHHDLIAVFQVGWTVLHADVAMYAATGLIEVLTGLRHDDPQIQGDLETLRSELQRQCRAGTPWRARDALEVILLLDMPAWATLAALFGECPVLPAATRGSRGVRTQAISATAFEFIAERAQIVSVQAFMESLPGTLLG